MTLKRDSRGTLRDYGREYSLYGASTKAKKDRASRNKARREALRKGRVHKGDSLDIHHPKGVRNNSHTVVISASKNRGIHEKSRLKGSKRSARHKQRG